MGTRGTIEFCSDIETPVACVYRHCGSHPYQVLPYLRSFFAAVKRDAADTRFNDAAYLAVRFLGFVTGGSWTGLGYGIVPAGSMAGVSYAYRVVCRFSDEDPKVYWRYCYDGHADGLWKLAEEEA